MWKKMVYANLLIMSSLLLCGVSISEGWYRDNYRIFSTQGHPKSKGLNMTIKYPGDWTAYEGERPNVVQVFAPDTEKNITFMIIARKLPIPENQTLTDEDIEDFFSHEEALSMIPPGSKLISYKKATIESLPAGILEYRNQTDRAGLEIEAHLVSYYLIYDKVMVFIQFSVSNIPELRNQIDEQFEQLRPMFFQIANSIVLPDKWTKTEKTLDTRIDNPEGFQWQTLAYLALACVLLVFFIKYISNYKGKKLRIRNDVIQPSDKVMSFSVPDASRFTEVELTPSHIEYSQDKDNELYEQDQVNSTSDYAKLKKFNWGAFLMAPLWNLVYKRWGWFIALTIYNSLLSKIDSVSIIQSWPLFLFGFALNFLSAINANSVGWKNQMQNFSSVDHFLRAQKKWILWGIVIYIAVIGLQFMQASIGV